MLDVVDDIMQDKTELSEHEKSIYRERELNNFKIVLERLMDNENFKNKISFIL